MLAATSISALYQQNKPEIGSKWLFRNVQPRSSINPTINSVLPTSNRLLSYLNIHAFHRSHDTLFVTRLITETQLFK
jgi:hypothetical protein